MSTQDQELKPLPCPKCHKNPPRISVYEWDCEDTTNMANHYLTTCQDCGYTFDGRGFTEEEAITKWNRRAMGLVDDDGDEVEIPPTAEQKQRGCNKFGIKAPSNTEKLREALEAIDKNTDLLDIAEDIAPKLHPSHSFVAVQIRKIVRAALATPPRNCDVGTAEEQAKRFKAFCLPRVGKCSENSTCPAKHPCNQIGIPYCQLKWAQMPYKPKD